MITHTYGPRGTCRELITNKSPAILLSGPAGTGKSRACLEKLMLIALKYPGCRLLILRKTLASLGSTALVTWRTKVAPEALKSGEVYFYGGSSEEAAQYRFRNGSTITVGGMDKAQKIMSSEYDAAYIQEATELTPNDWEMISTRLRNGVVPYQQLIADCNPDRPNHWLHEKTRTGEVVMLHSRHEDNPTLYRPDGSLTPSGASYISRLDALTGVRFQRLRRGLWVAAEGLVYDDYDPAVHLIDRFDIPDSWPRYWVIDFGFTNPFVCQWWAEDPDGRLYLYREIYRTQRLVEDHAKDVLGQVQKRDGTWREPKPVAVICDHDAEDRATFTRHSGFSTSPAKKGKTEGLQVTQARFKVAKDGRPRIFFLRDSLVKRDQALVDAGKPTSTVDEITGYVWPQGKTGDKAEEPVKEDDHGMDCARYMVAYRDLRGRTRLRYL